jgi:hypothetical protein
MVWDLQRAAAECRRHAAEFKQEAQKAWLPSTRRYYLEMAESWLALAQNYEFHLNLKRAKGELDQTQDDDPIASDRQKAGWLGGHNDDGEAELRPRKPRSA